jgi:4-carboxymuconolactone decarboxylase
VAETDSLPPDIHPDSRSRIPLITRDDLDDAGKALYDAALADPRSLAGMQGPGGIRMWAAQLTAVSRPKNRYLRFEAGLDRRLAEIAILATARECDQHFEWRAHELAALKEGVAPEIIDVIRWRKPLDGLAEAEATLIALARQAIGERRVDAATYATAMRLFGTEPLINFVSLMGDYAATAILLHVFDQQLPAGETSKLPPLERR